MAGPARAQRCPLCGEAVSAGGGLEALGKHFERCKATEAARRKDPGMQAADKRPADAE